MTSSLRTSPLRSSPLHRLYVHRLYELHLHGHRFFACIVSASPPDTSPAPADLTHSPPLSSVYSGFVYLLGVCLGPSCFVYACFSVVFPSKFPIRGALDRSRDTCGFGCAGRPHVISFLKCLEPSFVFYTVV